MGFTKKVQHFLHWFDIYAQPITLTYKGDAYYRTALGGTASIISSGMVIWFIIAQLVVLFQN